MKSLALVGLILILMSPLLVSIGNVPVNASATTLTGEVQLGGLFALTGDLATFGQNEKLAAELAVSEINAFLADIGAEWTLTLVSENTAINPAWALEKLESLYARSIELIVGPLSSGEVQAIKPYCDANQILAISPASTTPDLAIADDYILRFCPTDKLGQGPAIARIMYDDGKRYVIPVTRNDTWGTGIRNATEARFVDDLGGTFLPGILYNSDAPEFSTHVADLAAKVSDAIATYGARNVAILHISWEEATTFMTAARAFAVLDDVTWYGSDGTCTSGGILEDPDVRDFAVSVEYPCPLFAPTPSDKREKVRQHGLDVLGREPEAYSYVTYDIVWAYALSLLTVDAYDSEAVKAVLPNVTRNYFGASGWIELDDNGDRKAGSYDIWQIKENQPDEYIWEVVGAYSHTTDSVRWKPATHTPIYVFEPVWNGEIFSIVIDSNSTVADYYLNPGEGPFFAFNVTGLNGTAGFCRVAIPKQLLWVEEGNWTVAVGEEAANASVIKEDAYFTHLYFTYNHSTHNVEITGTHVVQDTTPPTITNVSQTPTAINVLPEDAVNVNATVTDWSGVKWVILNYTYTNSSGTWPTLVNMTNLEGNVWNATIPTFPYGTNLTYSISAKDNLNNTISTIDLGYEYQFTVISEFPSFLILPTFMIVTLLAAIAYRRKRPQ